MANVTERTRLAEVAQDLGPRDSPVAAAGISGMTPVVRDSDSFFDEILGADLTGPWNTVRAFLPKLGPGGRIVLVSSVLGRFGVPSYGAYCAATTRQTEAQFRAKAQAAVPVKRFFQPEEIAHGVAWLLNPANTMQVGQCLNFDGGVVQT